MNKPTYSEEDTQQIFQALFQEKKKNNELEQQLRRLEERREQLKAEAFEPNQDSSKLKEMMELLKQKIQISQSSQQEIEEEVHSLRQQLISLRKTAIESKESAATYKTAFEVAQAELEQYKNSLVANEDERQKIFESNEEVQRQKQRTDKLLSHLQEREKRIAELQQFELTNKKALEQKLEQDQELIKKQKIIHTQQEEIDKLNENWLETRKHCEQLERVVQHLRERSEEAYLETNQLQQESEASQDQINAIRKELSTKEEELKNLQKLFQVEEADKLEAQEELKTLLTQQSLLKNRLLSIQLDSKKRDGLQKDLSQMIETLKTDNDQLKQNLHIKNEECHQLNQTIIHYKEESRVNHESLQQLPILEVDKQHLQAQVKTQMLEIAALCEKNSQLEQASQILEKKILSIENAVAQKDQALSKDQDHIEQLTLEKQKLNAELSNLLGQTEEKDSKLRTAHQHLAKKVKETTLLSEKIEEQKNQADELQKALVEAQSQITELTSLSERSQENAHRLEEQLQEQAKSNEAQQRKWEEKYFQMVDKWQKADESLKELKKLEEKYLQIQVHLSTLTNFVNPQPISKTLSVTEMPVIKKAEPPLSPPLTFDTQIAASERKEPVQERSLASHDLFQAPREQPKVKKTLFDL